MQTVISIPGLTEPLSCLTHLVAGFVFLYLSFDLCAQARKIQPNSRGAQLALLSFSASCVFLLFTSSIFHLSPHGGEFRAVLQRVDHAGIFAFIAGTITAVEFLLFDGMKRTVVIGATWLIALIGMTIKVIYFHDISATLGASLYLGFGWIGVVSALGLCREHGFDFIKPLLFGAAAYTLGALCDTLESPTLISGVLGPHEIFHIVVVVGMAAHWRFILSSLPLYRERNQATSSATIPSY